jgi:hypothetical protein
MVSQLPSRCVRFSGARADMVGVMSFLPLNELPALFPHVVDWISYLEKQAQESGRALTPIELNLAQNVGVAHPEEVRVLSVPRIPLPAHPRVKQLARQVGLLNANTGGLTAGYGIIVRLDCAKNLRLLAHESVHVTFPDPLKRRPISGTVCRPCSGDSRTHCRARNRNICVRPLGLANSIMVRTPNRGCVFGIATTAA